ncbi:MAG: helix-turn-helix domain-containing protein [Thaumarchaeota archaeon]|nr:helix-turn-helix domain-containing protein [Nitrososphaerota archaeon]
MRYTNGKKEALDICKMYDISVRTFRRWTRAYKASGISGLQLKKSGPDGATNSISKKIEQKIVRLKQKQ